MCETDKNINKQTDRRRNLLGVPAFVKASQKHEITFISFAQLNYAHICFRGYVCDNDLRFVYDLFIRFYDLLKI